MHGQILKHNKANNLIIMVNHALDYVFVFIQTSTKAKQMVEAKHKFECFVQNYRISIKHYHADNKIFSKSIFHKSYSVANQILLFYSINAHYKNSIAKRNICTVILLARVMLFAAMIRNPGAVILKL